MKTSFRGYNRKEVDMYIEQLKVEYENRISLLNNTINELLGEIDGYKKTIDELEKDKKVVSDVLVDAVRHAQQIELDYKNRAKLSDEHYCQKANEWKNKMEACQSSIEEMKLAAKNTYDDLIARIDQFESWSIENVNAIGMLEFNNNLSEVSKNSVNITRDDCNYDSEALQNEILSGINSDLSQACKELGIGEE